MVLVSKSKWMMVPILMAMMSSETKSKPQSFYAEKLSDMSDINITAILDSFQVGYDKRVRPNYGGPAVVVGVTMFVLSISSLLEVEMDFTLDMYFRQFWRDPRLSFDSRPGLEKLVVGAEYINKIWVPDTFFVNEKKAYFHEATADNQFLRILHTGEILRSIRLTITASCPMQLQYFPMDRQTCFIDIESFGYTMSDIRYQWNDGLNSVQIASDVSLPQFKVIGHRQKTIEASLSTGNYSRLACEVRFVRSMGYYLIQIYIPSSLIVVISWVSFWLNRGASVARVNLGVTTVLTMTTLMASTNAALPKISYVKSIDVYLGACFFMVFASLLVYQNIPEYASVGYLAKRIQMRKNRILAAKNKSDPDKDAAATGESQPSLSPRPSVDTRRTSAAPDSPQVQQYYSSMPKRIPPNLRQPHPGIYHSLPQQQHPYQAHHPNAQQSFHHQHHQQYMGRTMTPQQQHFQPSPYSSRRTSNRYDPEAPPVPNTTPGLAPPVSNTTPGLAPPPVINTTPGLAPPDQIPSQSAALAASATESDLKELKDLNKMFGITASDIDKYSRIFFPVTFTCFQLMYWIIYQHLSDEDIEDLVYLEREN